MNIKKGFLWNEENCPPLSYADAWQPWQGSQSGEWTVRTFSNERMGVRIPGIPVAVLSDRQVQNLGLAEGDLISIKESGDGFEIVEVHGMSVSEWKSQTHMTSWNIRDNTPQTFGNFNLGEEDEIAALFTILFPVIKGSKILLTGVPGSEKSRVARELLKAAVSEKKVFLTTERSNEIPLLCPNPNFPFFPVLPSGVELWAIPNDVGTNHDQVLMTEFAIRTMCRAAPWQDIFLIFDSVSAYAMAANLSAGETSRTMSGGLAPETLERVGNILNIARHPTSCKGSLTLVALDMIVEKDGMSETLLRHMRGRCDSHIMAVRQGEGRILPWFPLSLSPKHTLHRKLENVIGWKAAQGLFNLHKAALTVQRGKPRISVNGWNCLIDAITHRGLTPQQIWAKWPRLINSR